MRPSIPVWDVPTRIFHWLLALCFLGAYLLAERDEWRLVHATLGFTAGALVVFRIAWGWIGTRHARFSSFAFRPREVIGYLHSLMRGQVQHYTGHNPAGSWAIYAMLALVLGTAASGYAYINDIGGHFVEEVHELLGNATLAIVIIHVMGVIVSSYRHRENLIGSMITGYKSGSADEAIHKPHRTLGFALIAAVLAFWANVFGVRDALIGDAVLAHERGGETSDEVLENH
ncbi:Cytochrome b [Fontimonas thermophila]|uniref:Cytochrome b n=2 Tax=Fontimonas thermophila TaxID=1076937 RepID=A0A1I2J5K6_9GAMM|nr:Cytochrome b [Fontimonas thermophila]